MTSNSVRKRVARVASTNRTGLRELKSNGCASLLSEGEAVLAIVRAVGRESSTPFA
jgi:hypothetical protein